jgi:glutathione synthase
MDPIGAIKPVKDSSFAMLLEAQRRGWPLHYMEQSDLYLRDGEARAATRTLSVRDDTEDWYALGEPEDRPLRALDVILMRKDPPFDMEYIYSTYTLERAQGDGVLIVNDPRSLRDANEKAFTAWFAECSPPTLISRAPERIKAFAREHGEIVIKPLDGMGGSEIFRVGRGDPNLNVIIETVGRRGARTLMAQRFLPEYRDGDKRILLIDGEPVPYALARIPAEGEARANLAAGGTGIGVELSERDRWICARIGPELKARGLVFVGLDVIGDWVTEINVTSPTGVRELDALYELNIAGRLMDAITGRLAT